MAITTLQRFAAGDTDYIAKLNSNSSATETAVNNLETVKETLANRGQPGGYPGLGSDGRVGLGVLPVTVELTTRKGWPGGYASLIPYDQPGAGTVPKDQLPLGPWLDVGGHIPMEYLPIAVQEAAGGAGIDLTTYQLKSAKGQPNGYAGLDGAGKVPDAQLPDGLARDSEVTAAISAAITAALSGYTPVIPEQPVMMTSFYPGKPAAGALLFAFLPTHAVSVPAGLTGSRCKAGTNPSTAATLSVRKNGSEVGTIAIATDGAITFAAASATSLTNADELTVVAPSPQDATLADIELTIAGSRSA